MHVSLQLLLAEGLYLPWHLWDQSGPGLGGAGQPSYWGWVTLTSPVWAGSAQRHQWCGLCRRECRYKCKQAQSWAGRNHWQSGTQQEEETPNREPLLTKALSVTSSASHQGSSLRKIEAAHRSFHFWSATRFWMCHYQAALGLTKKLSILVYILMKSDLWVWKCFFLCSLYKNKRQGSFSGSWVPLL